MAFSASINNENVFPIITLSDTSTGTNAELYSFGALLNQFNINTEKATFNIIEGFASPQDAIANITNGFKSAFLSPFTCRMNEGKYAFDGTAYQVEKFFMPPHAIHGIVFDAVYAIAETQSTDTFASVTFTHNYKKEDAGYPFSYSIKHVWKLEAGNKLSVTTTVQHDNNNTIPYAQGWHPYFTLGGNVDDLSIQFTTDKQVEFDNTLLPTGATISDERFKEGASLKDVFLDNCFHLSGKEQHFCVLKNDTLKLTISPSAAYPYLQIYTPPHRKSIAIENLSGAPDCFNNGLGLLKLLPNEPKTFATTYSVTLLN